MPTASDEMDPRSYMTAEEREFVARREFVEKSGMSFARIKQIRADQVTRADIEKRALAERHRVLSARANAERERKAAEAKAAKEREYAARYAAMSPEEREIEDFAREAKARRDAALAAEKAQYASEAEWYAAKHQPKREAKSMSVEPYDPPPPVDPNDVRGLEVRAQALARKAEAEPTEANKCQAAIAAAEARKAQAWDAFSAEKKASVLAIDEAVRNAGHDPVARERAKARAASLRAENLGQAEAAAEAASLAYDRTIVEIAKLSKTAAARIERRKAELARDEAMAEKDPHRVGNPYWRPPVSLADWQFEALDPATKKRAVADGVRIYKDVEPTFTADEVRAVLRMRGSESRAVVTRSELAAMSPADASRAARTSIVVSD